MTDQMIIGIDPGTAITGYGVVAIGEKGLSLIDFGCIRPPVKYKLSDRYKILFEGISSLIVKYQPIAMAAENQFVSKLNLQAGMKVGMARGVSTLAATLAGIETFIYPPKSVKLAATGTGNATKQQVQWMIQQYFRLKELPKPEDAADALAVAICHYHAMQTSTLPGVF
jgi:crossover junction endodeoxyribonuclease RuvC